MKDLSIIDLRIFNYISKTIDLNSSFLITDIFNSVINKKVLKQIHQIFIEILLVLMTSIDLLCAIEYSLPINRSIDCYSNHI